MRFTMLLFALSLSYLFHSFYIDIWFRFFISEYLWSNFISLKIHKNLDICITLYATCQTNTFHNWKFSATRLGDDLMKPFLILRGPIFFNWKCVLFLPSYFILIQNSYKKNIMIIEKTIVFIFQTKWQFAGTVIVPNNNTNRVPHVVWLRSPLVRSRSKIFLYLNNPWNILFQMVKDLLFYHV